MLGGHASDIYFFEQSLESCYRELSRRCDEYDAVICSSDIYAFSLLRRLQSSSGNPAGQPFIISCIASALTDKTTPTITAIEHDYRKYGAAVKKLINTFCKAPDYFSSVNINIPLRLQCADTTRHLPFTDRTPLIPDFFDAPFEYYDTVSPTRTNRAFYADKEVMEIQRFKRLLSLPDETDLKIVSLLRQNTAAKTICDMLFMSESGYNYRLKQIRQRCGFRDTRELKELIAKYMLHPPVLG